MISTAYVIADPTVTTTTICINTTTTTTATMSTNTTATTTTTITKKSANRLHCNPIEVWIFILPKYALGSKKIS